MRDLTKGRLLGSAFPFIPGMDLPPVAKRVKKKIPMKGAVKVGFKQAGRFAGPSALAFNVAQFGYAGYKLYNEVDWKPAKISGKSTTRVSRGRQSTHTSHRTKKAPSATHRSRNRCRHVDRRGKRCKLPAGHSGRHSY